MVQDNFVSIFLRFGLPKRLLNRPIFKPFSIIVISSKSLIFLSKFNDFSTLEPSEIEKKRVQNACGKNIETKPLKSRLGAPLWVPKTSQKSLQNQKKSIQKRRQTKPVSRRYANHAEVVGHQRGSAFVKRLNG